MKKILFLFFLLAIYAASAQPVADSTANVKKYYVLVPTGKENNKLPVLAEMPARDPRFSRTRELCENTFMFQSVRLYEIIQRYLMNNNLIRQIEPAYLLFSQRQGYFPMQGFYLSRNDSLIDKYKTFYIDMPDLDENPGRLMGMTQIFPHEMGHLFFSLLAPNVQEKYKDFSSDMHYFSVTTNYLTAFNEGFAEHFENASRLYESLEEIREGIRKDSAFLAANLPVRVARLDRDFRYPLRLNYYRAGMLIWYQRFEGLKRYQWALNEDFSKTNTGLDARNPEKSIQYRNIGLGMQGDRKRNAAQAASTEGVVSAFFSRLLQSGTKYIYMEPAMYFDFMSPRDSAGFDVKKITPLDNHYMKIFTVLNQQMNHPAGDTSFLDLFINGYIRQFPGEKELVENVYRDVTGLSFRADPLPEIWLMRKDQLHNYLLLDQFGGNTTGDYTMNLNTADEWDLRVFDELSDDDIRAILDYRDKVSGFRSMEEISRVPGLSGDKSGMLIAAHRAILDLKEDGEEQGGMNIAAIFIYNGGRILLNGLIWFAIFMVIFYFVFLHGKYPVRSIMVISFQKFLKLYMLILAGLVCFVFSWSPVLWFSGVLALLLAIDFLKTRKNPVKRREVIVTTLIMGGVIIYSLV